MNPIKFEKNKDLFNQNLSTAIEFTSEVSQQTIKALVNNDPIEDLDLPFVLGRGKIEASGPDKRFEFKNDASISIDGSIEGELRLGIFNSAEDITGDLKANDAINIDIAEPDEDEVYVIFSMGYALTAGASGKWMFTGGSLNAGIDTAAMQRMAVVRKVKKATGLFTAFQDILDQLRLPSMIKKVEDLSDDTWLVVQMEGSLEGSFGAQVGYDFNWIYEGNTPGLTGSIGLQAKLGAELGIGFNLAGQYALMLNKELADGKKALHMQLFRQRKNGWSFASGLAVSAKADLDNFGEDNLDELIKATIGIHYSQVLEKLNKIDELRDPAKLTETISGLSEEYLKKLTQTTGVEEYFQLAKSRLLKILDLWDKVGEDGGAALWKLLDNQTDVEIQKIRDDFLRIANGDMLEVQDFIEEKLSQYDFQNTDFGKVLNAIIPQEDIIEVILEQDLVKQLKDKASVVAGLLDTETKVKEFHEVITEQLSIDKIRELAEKDDLAEVGGWIIGHLDDLLKDENGNVVAGKLKEINDFIDKVKEKAEDIISKTKEALKKEYGASITYNYQKEKEGTALINVLFLQSGTKLHEVYKQALRGDFNEILTKQLDHIILKRGTLTHRVKKERNVTLTLPYMKQDFSHINESLAKGTFIDEEDGRLFLYELEAEDMIRKSKRYSQLALDGLYQAQLSDDFQKQRDTIRLSYSFKLAKKRFKTAHLEQIVEPFIKRYLKQVYVNDDQNEKKSIDDWIIDMDQQIERVNQNGPKNFGRTLLNLELRVPSSIGKAWYNAPSEIGEYVNVSLAIQEKLKEIIPMYFMENEEVFEKSWFQDELYAVLAYQSIPPNPNLVYKKKFQRHWDYFRTGKLEDQLFRQETKLRLIRSIGEIKARLSHDPDTGLSDLADKFDNQSNHQISEILNRANTPRDNVNINLLTLLRVENNIIKNTIEAGIQLAEFLETNQDSPKEAIKAFEQFGSIITDALNKYTGISVITSRRDYSRYLGPELFVTIAQALDPDISTDIQGMLELLVLKESSGFEETSYLGGDLPPVDDLIISQKIMNFS